MKVPLPIGITVMIAVIVTPIWLSHTEDKATEEHRKKTHEANMYLRQLHRYNGQPPPTQDQLYK